MEAATSKTRFSVITTRQLERIRAEAQTADRDTQRQEELARRKELSAARSARWPNTLQASRANKEQAAKQRADVEAAARAETDRQEAAARTAARQLAIERANKMLHDEGDRVKALHGRLMLSEVLVQNQALAEHKRTVAAACKKQEADFVEAQQQALRAAEQAELAKLEAEHAKLLAQRDVQAAQLEGVKARILAERAADKAEGELVRRKAAEEAEELRQKEAAWRAKMQAMNEATAAANSTLLAFRAAERERERLMDATIEDYCKRKAAADAERAAELEAKAAAKEARRKAQVELMERNYQAWHEKTEAALEADTRQAEERAAAAAEAQRCRRQEQLAASHRSNQQQLARKAAEADAQRAADRAFCDAWGTRLQQLREDERREVADARARALEVQRFQQWQAARRAARQQAERRADVQDALMAEDAVAGAEAEFREYAAAVAEEAARRGLPLKPIELCVAAKDSPIAASM